MHWSVIKTKYELERHEKILSLENKVVKVNKIEFIKRMPWRNFKTNEYIVRSVAIPKKKRLNWLKKFADGLALDNKNFRIKLFGGDLSLSSKIFLSATFLGVVEISWGDGRGRGGAAWGFFPWG